MYRFHPVDTYANDEEWNLTGHRQPPNPMKTIGTILLALVLLAFVMAFTGCVTETTRTITTDKAGTVTDTTVIKKGTDPAALKLVEVAAAVYLPKPAVIVREEKADHDMKRLLRGWRGPAGVAATGPITKEEIFDRYR
jgi:hypothetical protein